MCSIRGWIPEKGRFLDKMFKENMADIKRRLNTIYKDMDEDEISGNDAILIAAKKTYYEDVKQYYIENIFNKNDNWKKMVQPGHWIQLL